MASFFWRPICKRIEVKSLKIMIPPPPLIMNDNMTAAEISGDFKSNLPFNSNGEFSSKLSAEELNENVAAESSSSDKAIENNEDNMNNSETIEKSLSPGKCRDETGMEKNENISSSKETCSDSKCISEEDDWLDIMGSGDFKKKVLEPGEGFETRPNRGDMVTIHVKYYENDEIFEENKNLNFIVGDLDVIQGLDLVVCLMEKKEKAKVKIPSKLAYGKLGRSPDVPPNCLIECDIELIDVQPIDEDSLDVSKRLELGNSKRTRGNYYYERGEFLEAVRCYERAAEYLDGSRNCSGSSNEQLQEVVNLRIKVYNNTAAAHLKLSAYNAAQKSVESVLAIQPNNVKALFRKGKILAMLGNTDEAIQCMKTAASLEPETKIIQVELTKLKNKHLKEEQAQKAMYQRMFPRTQSKKSKPFAMLKNWLITGGVLAVAAGTMIAYRYHSS